MNRLIFSKRQYTEIEKRQDKIWDELTNSSGSVLYSLGIDYKDKNIYYTLKENKNRELIFGYFTDYKSCKKLQENIIAVSKAVDGIVESKDYGVAYGKS